MLKSEVRRFWLRWLPTLVLVSGLALSGLAVGLQAWRGNNILADGSLSETLGIVAYVQVAVCLMLGGHALSTDFASRSLTIQLLFEPRRLRLLMFRAAVVVMSCAFIAAVVNFFIVVLCAGAASLKNQQIAWQQLVSDIGRMSLACAFAGLVGLLLVAIFKSSMAVMAGYLLITIGEDALARQFDWLTDLTPARSLGRFAMSEDYATVSSAHLLVVLSVWTLVFALIACVVLRRRRII